MELDNGVPLELQQKWVEEIMALANRILDPKAMDIFEVQLKRGEDRTLEIDCMLISIAPTSKSIEIDLISWQGEYGCPHGSVTWLAKALKLEEAQLVFALDSQRVYWNESSLCPIPLEPSCKCHTWQTTSCHV